MTDLQAAHTTQGQTTSLQSQAPLRPHPNPNPNVYGAVLTTHLSEAAPPPTHSSDAASEIQPHYDQISSKPYLTQILTLNIQSSPNPNPNC